MLVCRLCPASGEVRLMAMSRPRLLWGVGFGIPFFCDEVVGLSFC
jgi:hypothetical protein